MNVLSDSNLDSVSIQRAALNDVILVFLLITLNIFRMLSSVFITYFEYMPNYKIHVRAQGE